jgi:hypothetical protein
MASANPKKIARKSTRSENKSRKKDALARAAQKASDAGKGNSKRITGYYVEKSGTGKNPISGQDRPNVVKPREARPFARAEKKAAKKGVRLAAYRAVAGEKLGNKKLSEAKASDKRSGTSESSLLGDTSIAKNKNSYRALAASVNKGNATSRAKKAGMSDKKVGKLVTKATKAAVKRSR